MIEEVQVDRPEDLPHLLSFLRTVKTDPNAFADLVKYKHKPVSPREFVTSPEFMNAVDSEGKCFLWPKVLDAFCEINDGTRTECVLTGAIGVAKTTLALYTIAYQVYILSCLRNPHKELDQDPATEITMIIQSLNKNLASDVDYARLRAMCERAPYFKNWFPFDAYYLTEMRFPSRIIVKPISGKETGSIGQNVIGGIIDEINFMAVVAKSKQSHDGLTYDQAVENYSSIARRRESRFQQKGWMPGMLCLVSSRNYPGQFTDRKEEEARKNPKIYVYDKRLWELRPERFDLGPGNMFDVFVGDATRKPYILKPDQKIANDDKPLVMEIPNTYRDNFERDMLKSLRDIAGVATAALHPFILEQEAINLAFGKTLSALSRDDCDFKSTKAQLYPKRFVRPQEPRFAHIDLAFSKDSCGLAIGFVDRFEHMKRGGYQETLPVIRYDLLLEIKPPKNGEIEFENVRKVLYAVRDHGVNLKWISFDTFQSKDSQQILHQQGFVVGVMSMDADTLGYDVLKQALYDKRVMAPACPKAMKELIGLEIDPKTRKIDHPPQGSKDITDAMAGVAYGLTMRREVWIRHGVPLTRIPQSLTAAVERAAQKDKGSTEAYVETIRQTRGMSGAQVQQR